MFRDIFPIQTFACRIKELRKARDMTQQDVADYLDLTRTQISDMENAKTATSIDRLYALCCFFEVSSDYLLGLSDDPELGLSDEEVKEVVHSVMSSLGIHYSDDPEP